MRLTDTAIDLVKQPQVRVKLALALSCTEQWIIKLINQNKENGTLTTVKALRVIMQETKLRQSEILTDECLKPLADKAS